MKEEIKLHEYFTSIFLLETNTTVEILKCSLEWMHNCEILRILKWTENNYLCEKSTFNSPKCIANTGCQIPCAYLCIIREIFLLIACIKVQIHAFIYKCLWISELIWYLAEKSIHFSLTIWSYATPMFIKQPSIEKVANTDQVQEI